jgi:hypothetical protein
MSVLRRNRHSANNSRKSKTKRDRHPPIRNALEQGRLHDFFMIVANLLRTYNWGSPFVSVSDWRGEECAIANSWSNSNATSPWCMRYESTT